MRGTRRLVDAEIELIDCTGCTDIDAGPSALHALRQVTLQANDVEEAYLAEVSPGSLRAGGYRRLLEENAQGSLQEKKHGD